ncbi:MULTISPECIES: hypothetical protein [unclassified Streptomyces]|uniref:hypothetical protein n=1 Tax=unclassified Streptomyces TaxID=2593676 RepID=UPI00081ED154|nr:MULTISPECIES: hypothetical protein [unclassified Streptomyces]MYZ35683.1 hypothetical protein [Streptomyces sp. SID4917]SCF77584.1 hypothetical protein GA0115259_102405 [Streptomyces sp. MnatMP-M17]
MNSPSPVLIILALLWTVAAGTALIASITLSVRGKRREAEFAAWNPFGTGFLIAATAAIASYAVAAIATDHFSPSGAAFGVLWPAMAAMALSYVARRRTPSWPWWASAIFAAVGAALYGSLPM